ncbi:TetR/AcrR family transcriptional regulator [Kineococcus gypseus]|uniref:TetR/AcrR family transcriptional regulator n=1 Tax=Kineococcus gypseus TaxID=1637102 RepID=UPI003D7DB527
MSTGTPLRADAARNRERVVEVARRHLLEHGLPFPMNALARSAGVGVGTVYRHFPTQEALLEAIALPGLRALTGEVRAAAALEEPAAALRAVLAAALARLRADAGLAAVLAATGFPGADRAELVRELQAGTEEVLERARRAGAVRAGIGADDVRRLLCGVDHAVRSGGDDRTAPYLDVLVAGLRG